MSEQLAKKEVSASERFMSRVIVEFGSSVGEIALTGFQKRLAQNYFVAIDSALKLAEEKRLKKTKNQDALPVIWSNLNMEKLARDVVSCARIGFDPAQKNHIHMLPFKNNTINKYDIVFIEGYRGIELKATKYGMNVPDNTVVEVVYSNDRFKSIKKDNKNPFDTYEFEIMNDFDRGDIIGGFYYHAYNDHPDKNKIVVLPIKEILKRKPEYASVEFWGGEKDVWKNGQKVGTEHSDGWYEKMVYKTIYRAAYSDITIDSQKIDDDYMRLKANELKMADLEVEQEITEKANKEAIDIEAFIKVDREDEETPKETPALVQESSGAPF